jgi:uncharacterized membrane protein (UPF0127 family)
MPLESPAAHPSGRRQVKGRALAAIAAAALIIAACSSGSDVATVTPSEPDSAVVESEGSESVVAESATTVEDVGVQPDGFTTAMVEITKADGTVCEVCVWLADSGDERGQGLMGVTSLGTPEGMAFVWEEPRAGFFFMFQTVTPLSIGWFGAPDGALVSTADMEPCVSENSANCERYLADGDYVLAIEVFQGDLASIGITDGARARLLPGSEAADCPLA